MKQLSVRSAGTLLLCLLCTLQFLYSNCQTLPPLTEAAQAVVLTVGNIHITQYELEKNHKRFTSEYRHQHGKMPGKEETDSWLEGFSQRTWFLADAFKKGYFNKEEVNRSVEGMAHLIVSQPNGLLEQKLLEEQLTREGIAANDPQRNMITGMLREQLKEKIRQEYTRDIATKTIVTDTVVLGNIAKKLNTHGPFTVFEKDSFSDLLNKQVLQYTLHNKKASITVAQFMDHYNSLPLRKPIGSREQLTGTLQGMVYDAWAWSKAQELGITKEARFLLDKDNYKKLVVYNSYETTELKPGIVVTEEEINDRYNAGKNNFRQAATAVVSLFLFNNAANAMAARFAIKTNGGSKEMPGLQNIQQHVTIEHDQTNLPDTVMRIIFSINVQDVSAPLMYKNNFLVVYKESESGSSIKSLATMKPVLLREIENEKLQRKKQAMLQQLRTSYPVTDHIDHRQFYTQSTE